MKFMIAFEEWWETRTGGMHHVSRLPFSLGQACTGMGEGLFVAEGQTPW
jgi:hypothetical protein